MRGLSFVMSEKDPFEVSAVHAPILVSKDVISESTGADFGTWQKSYQNSSVSRRLMRRIHETIREFSRCGSEITFHIQDSLSHSPGSPEYEMSTMGANHRAVEDPNLACQIGDEGGSRPSDTRIELNRAIWMTNSLEKLLIL